MVAKALKLRDRERVRLLSRLDGLDLRCEPIEERKAELARLSLLKEKIVEYQWEDPKSLHYRAVLTQVLQSMMRIAEF